MKWQRNFILVNVTFTVAFVYMKLGWKTHVFDKKGGINVGN